MSTTLGDEQIEADEGGHGFIKGDTLGSQLRVSYDNWRADIAPGTMENVHCHASSGGDSVRLCNNFEMDNPRNTGWWHTTLSPTAAILLAEQLITAARHASDGEHWTPETSWVDVELGKPGEDES